MTTYRERIIEAMRKHEEKRRGVTTTDRLEHLISLCKATVTVTINDHKNDYQSVGDYLTDRTLIGAFPIDLAEDVTAEIIKRDLIVEVQAYSDTPVGFYLCVHYDLATAIKTVIGWIEESRKR